MPIDLVFLAHLVKFFSSGNAMIDCFPCILGQINYYIQLLAMRKNHFLVNILDALLVKSKFCF